MSSPKTWTEKTPEDRGEATPAALFRRHAQAVLAVCIANVRNYHDAEDVVQAVLPQLLSS